MCVLLCLHIWQRGLQQRRMCVVLFNYMFSLCAQSSPLPSVTSGDEWRAMHGCCDLLLRAGGLLVSASGGLQLAALTSHAALHRDDGKGMRKKEPGFLFSNGPIDLREPLKHTSIQKHTHTHVHAQTQGSLLEGDRTHRHTGTAGSGDSWMSSF